MRYYIRTINNTNKHSHIFHRDFDPAETVKDKVMKIGEVKGARGLRKLIKELAITVSTGKHDNELVGIAKLPLKVSYLMIINL